MFNFGLICICATLILTGNAHAQDSRLVKEPEIPPTCAYLISNKSLQNKDISSDQINIQNAIDQCPSGRSVHLASSNEKTVFLSGPISIKSGVSLVIDKGTTLFASTDPKLYDKGLNTCGTTNQIGHGCKAFITVNNTHSSSIMGQGIIEGQGNQLISVSSESWWGLARRAQKENSQYNIPRLIEINNSTDFSLYKITLKNSPNFHVALTLVDGFTAWGVKIDSPMNARNTDGIDPISSKNITITKSFIRTGDDSIAIKAGFKGISENISILDNHFYNGHGLSIGSETISGVRNVWVDQLSLDGGTAGLRIKSDISRGGPVNHIKYSRICLQSVKNPIEFTQLYNPKAQGQFKPEFSEIEINSVYSLSPGKIVIHNLPTQPFGQIRFERVQFSGQKNFSLMNASEPNGIEYGTLLSDLKRLCSNSLIPYPETLEVTSRPELSEQDVAHYSMEEVFKYAGLPGKEIISPWMARVSDSSHIDYVVNPILEQEDSTHFKTIQAAINQLIRDVKNLQLEQRQFVAVYPGIYNEVVYIPNLKVPISIKGMGATPSDTVINFNLDASLSGTKYAQLIEKEFSNSDSIITEMFDQIKAREKITTFGTATLWTRNKGFQLTNITIENSYTRQASICASDCEQFSPGLMHQAVALMVDGADQSIFSNIRLLGLQDTLYLKSQSDHFTSRSYFIQSYIQGDVDFIFGDATAFFYKTEIKSLGTRKDSYVGAPSTHVNSRYGFVFDHCHFTSDNSQKAQLGVYRLARQWFHNQKCTPYGSVLLDQYSCQLGSSDSLSESKGYISPNTIQNVGKMIVMNSIIGPHINKTHPWADWNTLGKISYRPVQYTKENYIQNLKEIGFIQLLSEMDVINNKSHQIFLSEYKNF